MQFRSLCSKALIFPKVQVRGYAKMAVEQYGNLNQIMQIKPFSQELYREMRSNHGK